MAAAANQGRTLERAFDVLQCIEEARSPIRLSAISQRTGLHLATTQRIVAQLTRLGYVQSSSLGYSLGPVVLAQAHAFVLQDPLVKASQTVLADLSQSTGLTASIHVQSGYERIVVARVEPPEPLRYQLPIGERLPLDVGVGKVLLAFAPEEELERYLTEYTETRLATGEVQTADSLREQLSTIREAGFHLAASERHLGTVSAAGIIRNSQGEPAGALNIVAHDDTAGIDDLRKKVPELLRAGDFIGQQV